MSCFKDQSCALCVMAVSAMNNEQQCPQQRWGLTAGTKINITEFTVRIKYPCKVQFLIHSQIVLLEKKNIVELDIFRRCMVREDLKSVWTYGVCWVCLHVCVEWRLTLLLAVAWKMRQISCSSCFFVSSSSKHLQLLVNPGVLRTSCREEEEGYRQHVCVSAYCVYVCVRACVCVCDVGHEHEHTQMKAHACQWCKASEPFHPCTGKLRYGCTHAQIHTYMHTNTYKLPEAWHHTHAGCQASLV